MKTAIYIRVSMVEQSFESQMHAISTFLKYKGISDYKTYSDHGHTGKNASRPALKTLLDDCKQGKVETLIIYKLDRLFRSQIDLLNTLELFKQWHVTLVSVKENIDLGTPAGRLMVQMLGAMAEFERSIIVERVNAGLAAARARGVKLGRVSTISAEKREDIRKMKEHGARYKYIATQLGVSIDIVKKVKIAS